MKTGFSLNYSKVSLATIASGPVPACISPTPSLSVHQKEKREGERKGGQAMGVKERGGKNRAEKRTVFPCLFLVVGVGNGCRTSPDTSPLTCIVHKFHDDRARQT